MRTFNEILIDVLQIFENNAYIISKSNLICCDDNIQFLQANEVSQDI